MKFKDITRKFRNMYLIGALGLGLASQQVNAIPVNLRIRNFAQPGVGGKVAYSQHINGAQEGLDGNDHLLANSPPNPNPQWLEMYTIQYGNELDIDARSPDSTSVFHWNMSVRDTLGTGVTTRNTLELALVETPSDLSYTYRFLLHLNEAYSKNGQEYILNGEIPNSGERLVLSLPGIVNVPNGAVYGTLDVWEVAPEPETPVRVPDTGSTAGLLGLGLVGLGMGRRFLRGKENNHK